ncbi:MAG: hypothetical protein U0821_20780 [Chloroflexota bacterium]
MINRLIDVGSYVLGILPLVLALCFLVVSAHGKHMGCIRKAIGSYLILGCFGALVFFFSGVIAPRGTESWLRLVAQTSEVMFCAALWPFVALMFP